jgi:hypothetical protein
MRPYRCGVTLYRFCETQEDVAQFATTVHPQSSPKNVYYVADLQFIFNSLHVS